MQPSAELTSQVLSKAPKISNTKDHVDLDVNISNVVVNKNKLKCRQKFVDIFFFYISFSFYNIKKRLLFLGVKMIVQ